MDIGSEKACHTQRMGAYFFPHSMKGCAKYLFYKGNISTAEMSLSNAI